MVVIGVVVLDVVVVLAVARLVGIAAAVTAGVASMVAMDWYSIPPTHVSMVPDAQNSLGLAGYLVTGVLLGELAVTARHRAVVSERAPSLLASEQAALRRVATLVAVQTSPGDVFASVTEEVGRLSRPRHRDHGSATRPTVRRRWSQRGASRAGTSPSEPGWSSGVNVATTVFRTREPVQVPRLRELLGSTGGTAARDGRSFERRLPDAGRRHGCGA